MNREEIIKNIKEEIAEQEEALKTLEYVPFERFVEVFPEGSWHKGWRGDCRYGFHYNMPYVNKTIHEFELFIATEFPEWKKFNIWENVDASGAVFDLDYHLPIPYQKMCITVRFLSNNPGSTCVLNKIGEKEIPAKIVPIYEVVCKQEAADEFTVKEQDDLS